MVLECLVHHGSVPGGGGAGGDQADVKLLSCDKAKVKDHVSHLLSEYFIGEQSAEAPASLRQRERDSSSQEGGDDPRAPQMVSSSE